MEGSRPESPCSPSAAAEATQEMVARLTGVSIDREEAAKAVKAELNV